MSKEQLKKDLRKEHFKLGSDGSDMKTTNMDLQLQGSSDNQAINELAREK